MELVFGFLAGWLSSIGALVGFSLLAVWNEYQDSSWGLISLILATVAAVLFFQIPLVYVLYSIPAYLVIGFIWSFYRYARYVADKVDYYNTYESNHSPDLLKKRLSVNDNVGRITYWVIVWPASFLENLLKDLLSFVSTTVRTRLNGVYTNILNSQFDKNIKVPDRYKVNNDGY